jgi:hypothetical protein
MRTYEEYHSILRLWEAGNNKSEIERITQIPRPTIRDCINRFGSIKGLEGATTKTVELSASEPLALSRLRDKAAPSSLRQAYAYGLGLYLGDGSIDKTPRVYRLRVALDAKYPGIIQECVKALETLLPDNKIGVAKQYFQGRLSCVHVTSYYKFWPAFFPQHGEGLKHLRRIELELWQQEIVDAYPLLFWKGLYHSDGSRYSNVVNGTDYPRYQFSNLSADIIQMFCNTCDKLGLYWTTKKYKSKLIEHGAEYIGDIYISKRKDVAFLDREVGPKR